MPRPPRKEQGTKFSSNQDKFDFTSKHVTTQTKAMESGFRKFTWTQLKNLIQSFVDSDQIIMLNNTMDFAGFLTDLPAAGDEATRLTVIKALFKLAVDQATPNVNKKDIVAANRTAWIDTCVDWLALIVDMRYHLWLLEVLSVVTRSNTGDWLTNGFPAIMEDDAMQTIISELQNRKLKVPQVAIDIADFLTWYCIIQNEYVQGNQHMPSSIFIPLVHNMNLADYTTLKDRILGNVAAAQVFSAKFGMKETPFVQAIVSGEAVHQMSYDSPDFLAWASFMSIQGDAGSLVFNTVGGLQATYTTHRIWHYEGKPMSYVHRLGVFMQPYSAANNPYGMMIKGNTANAANDKFQAFKVARSVTTFSLTALIDYSTVLNHAIFQMLPCIFEFIKFDPTGIAASYYLTSDYHPIFNQGNVVRGKDVSQAEFETWVERFFVDAYRGVTQHYRS